MSVPISKETTWASNCLVHGVQPHSYVLPSRKAGHVSWPKTRVYRRQQFKFAIFIPTLVKGHFQSKVHISCKCDLWPDIKTLRIRFIRIACWHYSKWIFQSQISKISQTNLDSSAGALCRHVKFTDSMCGNVKWYRFFNLISQKLLDYAKFELLVEILLEEVSPFGETYLCRSGFQIQNTSSYLL